MAVTHWREMHNGETVRCIFSDRLSRACKVRDEYSLVKDLVQDREQKRLAVAPVTAPYGSVNDARKGMQSSVAN